MLEDVSKRQNLGEQNEQAYKPILPFLPNRSITTKRAKDILHVTVNVFGGTHVDTQAQCSKQP
jgi:hypothetical protein